MTVRHATLPCVLRLAPQAVTRERSAASVERAHTAPEIPIARIAPRRGTKTRLGRRAATNVPQDSPSTFCRTLFQIERAGIAQLWPGSLFLLSALRGFMPGTKTKAARIRARAARRVSTKVTREGHTASHVRRLTTRTKSPRQIPANYVLACIGRTSKGKANARIRLGARFSLIMGI